MKSTTTTKATKKATTKKAEKKPRVQRELSQRQEIFARFVAQGEPAKSAYVKAGYKSVGRGPETHSSRLVASGKIKERIAALIDEERVTAKALSRMTKSEKLEVLEKIAKNNDLKPSDRINAIKVHNDMTGDNEPTRQIIDSGANLLEAIRQRAREMSSPMQRIAVTASPVI